MLKKIQTVFIIAILSSAGTLFADEGNNMQKMLERRTTQTLPVADDRVELKLPESLKVKQKTMMRVHMTTVAEIAGALAENDLEKTVVIAR